MLNDPIRSCAAPSCFRLSAIGRDAPAAAERLRMWRGRSGRTYLASVYPLGAVPDYCDAVFIAASGASAACHDAALVLTRDVEAQWAAAGVRDVHVHLLAGDEAERAGVLADLLPRH